MEFGSVAGARSHKLSETVVLYASVRKPGFDYRFSYFREGKEGKQYRCCCCRELGSSRPAHQRNAIASRLLPTSKLGTIPYFQPKVLRTIPSHNQSGMAVVNRSLSLSVECDRQRGIPY